MVAIRHPLRYAITNISSFPSDSPDQRRLRLEADLRRWAVDGVDTVQLREKALNTGELFALATLAMKLLRTLPDESRRPRLLINSRIDVALAAGADGVHLSAQPGALTPPQVRAVFAGAGRHGCTVSVSCHTPEEVAKARQEGADMILFGPVFEKCVGGELVVAGKGLPILRQVCLAASPVPLLALGGVTPARLAACLDAGASGFASIRAFEA